MSSKIKKLVDEARESENPELDLVDKGIVNILEIPGFGKLLSQEKKKRIKKI